MAEEKTTQNTPRNPVTAYPQPEFPQQDQSAPGLAKDMQPAVDHGEDTYVGAGRLADRVAVITGADSGIGRAAAIAYAREGADVVLSYLPAEQEDADQVVALVEAAGRRAVAVPGDLSQESANTELVQKAVDAFGRIDVLVVNAGKQTAVEDIADLTSEQFDATLKTNAYALFWVTKAAVPHMQPGASIIASTSVQAYQPSPTLLDYASTKSFINAYTKALAGQLAPQGIRVNAVAPGPFWTPLQISGGQPPEARPEFGSQTPLGRAGQPAEIAGAYVHLACAESSYTTGSTLSVTGGMPTP